MSDTSRIVKAGRSVLELERDALARAAERLDDGFARAIALMRDSKQRRVRVIVSGVGKSGLIGRKIAATLTSTGTPATFLHPTDGLHGDLGIVDSNDVAILVSKSGESDELATLIDHLKRLDVKLIAITGNMKSTLARIADVALDASVSVEACPHDLAPTTSTTVALAIGDALAVTLLDVFAARTSRACTPAARLVAGCSRASPTSWSASSCPRCATATRCGRPSFSSPSVAVSPSWWTRTNGSPAS
jgi:arabinose-5-phosphate isomerase